MANGKATLMARKKPDSEIEYVAVKIRRTLILKAKNVAIDQGKSLADYVSDSLKPIVERDWAKALRKAAENTE